MNRFIIGTSILLSIVSCQDTKESSEAQSDPISTVPVKTPQLFAPSIISSEHSEFDIIFTNDTKTVYFTRRVGNGKQKIYTSTYTNGKWKTPEIASFSTDRDEYPNLTPDGKTIYFGSARPIPNRPNKGNFDTNIWRTDFKNGSWTTPVPLSPTINNVQAEGEEWPVSNENHFNTYNGKIFYLCTMLSGEVGIDLYQTTKKGNDFTKPEKLGVNINDEKAWEYAPKITPDGQYLIFQGYGRPDSMGGDDVYISKKDANGDWLPSQNMGTLVNSEGNECPTGMTSDGKYFFFTRQRPVISEDETPVSDIYFIETEALQLEKLFTL